MKLAITSALTAAVLMNASVAMAAKVTESKMRETISRSVKENKESEILAQGAKKLEEIKTGLARSSADGSKSSSYTAGLNKQGLVTDINGAIDVNVSVIEIADAVVTASDVIKDSRVISDTELDTKASQLKTNLTAGLQAYSRGIGLIAGKISSPKSASGKAVSKILLMGREMARGKLSAEEAASYTKLMQLMTDAIQSGQANTAEKALELALKGYDKSIDVAKKIEELLGCRI
jgi:hypothetical protein